MDAMTFAERRVSLATRIVVTLLAAMFALSVVEVAPAHAADDSFGCGDDGCPQDPETSDKGVTGKIADAAMNGVSALFAQGAVHALSFVLQNISPGASPQVANPASSGNWFSRSYSMMLTMGLWVLMPLLFISIIHAVAKGSLQLLMKSVLVSLPIAVLGTVVALQIVQLLLDVTDDMSDVFMKSVAQNTEKFFEGVAIGFAGGTHVPAFIVILLSIMLLVTSIGLYIILVMREASIYIATAFLPIGFAMLVWPTTAKFFVKMVNFLVGVILSKVVMAAGIALAIASLTAATPNGKTTEEGLIADGQTISVQGMMDGGDGKTATWVLWIGNTTSAIVMFMIVALAPTMTMKLVGNIVGEASGQVAAAIARPTAIRQILGFNRTIGFIATGRQLVGNATRMPAARREAKAQSMEEMRLKSAGVFRNGDGNFKLTSAELTKLGVDKKHHKQLMDMTDPTKNRNNADMILRAHAAASMGSNFDGFDVKNGAVVARGKNGERAIIADMQMANGASVQYFDPKHLRRLAQAELDTGASQVRLIVPIRTASDGRPVTKSEQNQAKAISNMARDLSRRNQRVVRAVWDAPATASARINRTLDPTKVGQVVRDY